MNTSELQQNVPVFPAGSAEDSDDDTLSGRSSQDSAQYRFRKFIPRTVLNTLGPVLVLSFYAFVVVFYFDVPARNGIIPKRPIDANVVFYAWWVINISVLDWARSGIAGLEAAALMHPKLAPKNARQLMWHADRDWGSPTGWWKVLVAISHYIFRMATSRKPVKWMGPAPLWFYLAFSSILLYVGVPMSGLSMNQATAMRHGSRYVDIIGVNQTTFDLRAANSLAEQIGAIWRQGRATTPQGAAIFYAPEGTPNVSGMYYEDAIQAIYQDALLGSSARMNQTVTIFSGPEVAERAFGRAWGFMATISCAPVHPYTGLRLLNVTSVNHWRYMNGATFETIGNFTPGGTPLFADASETLGVNYQYVLATDDDIDGVSMDYHNAALLPRHGTAEVVMWQAYNETDGDLPDQAFQDLVEHPLVVASMANNGLTYLGFGVRCTAVSDVGHAALDATTNTFSGFVGEASSTERGGLPAQLTHYPGVMTLTSLAYAAMANVFLGFVGPGGNNCDSTFTTLCNGWASANAATDGVPTINGRSRNFQPPTISPERMALAMHKLLGQVAATVMGTGPGNWTCCAPDAKWPGLGLYGLEPANDLVPGIVPYRLVLWVLSFWAVVTVLPQLWPPFLRRRWGDTLDGFTMFRLGAECTEAVHRLEGLDMEVAGEADALEEVPGMVGDMNPNSGSRVAGFVGLSFRRAATTRDKPYTFRAQGK